MRCFVVMGVAGSGKSTVGALVAEKMAARYVDGDDLHPQENIAKMAAGTPLDDADRWPWLDSVGDTLAQSEGQVVIGCSALKRSYRDRIRVRVEEPVLFLHLTADKDTLLQRMEARQGHFMPVDLLDSQLKTLEPLEGDEASISLDINAAPEEISETFVNLIRECW
ncbi:MAG: gluconokinase [Pseudomonadota bacterium]